MVSAASIPTMHSIIMRSSAKARRLANDAQASAESANITSKQHHQAGYGHKQQSGAIMNPTRQNIDLNFSGQIRGAYDTQNAMRGVLN
jgi:lipopolysaccharide export system protein LptC